MTEEWVESVDPRTGRTFYANPITRETRWDKPISVAPAAPPAAPPAPPATPSLPPNWEQMSDEATGRVFYVDHVRKITQWNHPGGGNDMIHTTTTPTTNNNNNNNNHHQESLNGYNTTNNNNNNNTNTSNELSHTSSGWMSGGSESVRNVSVRSSTANSMMSFSLNFLSPIDFVVQEVPDEMRSHCPSCNVVFANTAAWANKKYKRRHHCRLCGDVVCHDCSPNKVLLPLEGDQYSKPVRVCNACHVDVERGDYFSMRRYLTPLTLYSNTTTTTTTESLTPEQEEQVCGALLALAQDWNAVLQDPSTFADKVTLSAKQLISPVVYYVGNHNFSRDVRDYAITALSVILAVGNVVDRNDYLQEISAASNAAASTVVADALQLLEQSRPMEVQKQIVRALYYLTSTRSNNDRDLCERVLRNMLDGCMMDGNGGGVSLQRWAVATLQNVISVLLDVDANFDFVSCGAVMILCTLLSSDDADIRNHATAALTATLYTSPSQSANIANAIYESGALQISLVQMLLSADTTIVTMACTFTKCLLLLNAGDFPVPPGMIHALIQIVNSSRPLDLRSMSLQILALLKAQDDTLVALIAQQITTCQYWASRELSGWHLVESCCLLHTYNNNNSSGEELLRYWIQYLEHCPSHLPSAFAEDQTVPCTLLEAIRQPLETAWMKQQQQQQQQNGSEEDTGIAKSGMTLSQWSKEACDAGIGNLLLGLLQQQNSSAGLHARACGIVAAMSVATPEPPINLPLALAPQVFAVFQSTALNSQTYSNENTLLLEQSLLAMGSLCGANIRIFDSHTTVHPSTCLHNNTHSEDNEDQKKMAEMVGQVLDNNAFLPALLVGAYGEGCIWAALRLAYAISNVHPPSIRGGSYWLDLLQQGSSSSPARMSMVLAILRNIASQTAHANLLRDCLPHLHKAPTFMESIWTLAAFAQNTALHNTLLQNSLPTIQQCLLTPNQDEKTVEAALLLVQRLGLQHPALLARAGMGTPLCQLIGHCSSPSNQFLALQLLHSLSSHPTARLTDTPNNDNNTNTMDLFHSGSVAAAVYAITANSTTSTSTTNTNNHATESTKMAMQILQYHLQDVTQDTPELAAIVVQAMTRQKRFLQLLCSTFLLTDDTSNTDSSNGSTTHSLIDASLYGSPLSQESLQDPILVNGMRDALLFLVTLPTTTTTTTTTTQSATTPNELLWEVVLLSHQMTVRPEDETKYHATLIVMCAQLLLLQQTQSPPPDNLPVAVQMLLLQELQTHILAVMDDDVEEEQQQQQVWELMQLYQIPNVALQLCAMPELRSLAFPILEKVLMEQADHVLPILMANAQSVSTCLELLGCDDDTTTTTTTTTTGTTDNNHDHEHNHHNHGDKPISRVMAQVMGTCAERGLLAPAVVQFNLRPMAIASLSAACLDDDDTQNTTEDDTTYVMSTEDGGSSITKSCLHALVGIFSHSDDGSALSVTEAQAIANTMGAKLSNVVLQRFVQQAEDFPEHDIRHAPEVALLCQLASIPQALGSLCAHGGLEALSLVANEGEPLAIQALVDAAHSEPTLVLDVEGHISILHVLLHSTDHNSTIQLPCLSLLSTLCQCPTGPSKIAQADDCHDLLLYCSTLLAELVQRLQHPPPVKNDKNNDADNVDAANVKEAPEKEERVTAFWERKQAEKKDSQEYALELAAIHILSYLMHQDPCRNHILHDTDTDTNHNLMASVYFLATHKPAIHLQWAALTFLWNAIPYLPTSDTTDNTITEPEPITETTTMEEEEETNTEEEDVTKEEEVMNEEEQTKSVVLWSVESLEKTLVSMVEARDLTDKFSYNNIGVETPVPPMGHYCDKQQQQQQQTVFLNPNLIAARAMTLLQEVSAQLVNTNQLWTLLSQQLGRLLDHTIGRNQNKNKKRILFQTNSGRLAHDITYLLQLLYTPATTTSNSCSGAVTALVSLVLYHEGSLLAQPSSSLEDLLNDEWRYWNAATTHALQLLSLMPPSIFTTIPVAKLSLPKRQKMNTPTLLSLMIPSLLHHKTQQQESSRAILAQRLLSRLPPS